MLRVAFICTGNSARSILSEALLNHHGRGRLTAVSAGTKPTGQVNPGALAVLDGHGIATNGLRSKMLEELQDPDTPVDLVITVCDAAANEECPIWPGMPVSGHWGLPDPAAENGSEADVTQAFEDAFTTIERRIKALAALDFSALDRAALLSEISAISQI